MEHLPRGFADYACPPVFVSIIGRRHPNRRATASFSRKDALDDLIA
jgi:hypothetical protein